MTERRLPRTVRLDASDASAFERAAYPGEWAVPGGFCFVGENADTVVGKRRLAFTSAFLGTATFGWSTFAEVDVADAREVEAVVAALASHLIAHFGAPSEGEATRAAREEIDFAASLCSHPIGTLLTMSRYFDEDGEIVEQYATITPEDTLGAVHASPIDIAALAAAKPAGPR